MGGKEEVALALLDHGALINAQDKEGEQPIHYAAAENSEAMILLLVDAGNNVVVGSCYVFKNTKLCQTTGYSRISLKWTQYKTDSGT